MDEHPENHEHGHPEEHEPPEGEIAYKDRQITYREEEGGMVLRIDGVEIDTIARLDDGQYHTHYFPFRGYLTIEALAQALVDTEGEFWILDRGGADHPH